MIKTDNHNLNKPEVEDEVLDTIVQLNENFEIIDGLLDQSASVLNIFLQNNKEYKKGKRIWNDNPVVGGNMGWVNIRTGLHAPTWQSRTVYRIGDKVITDPNNGHVYECIENGTSGLVAPPFPTTSGSNVFDHFGASAWIPNYVYEVDDLVLQPLGNQLYYYRCIQEGTSDVEEPEWSNESGTLINDGTVIWKTYKTIRWKEVGSSCEFREFGNIL